MCVQLQVELDIQQYNETELEMAPENAYLGSIFYYFAKTIIAYILDFKVTMLTSLSFSLAANQYSTQAGFSRCVNRERTAF